MPDGRLTLYLDWCQVRVVEPFPLTPEQLARFAADTGRPPGVGFMRVVLAEQVRRGFALGGDRVVDLGRGDDRLLRAARLCPVRPGGTVGWVAAVTGRRDAVVLVARWAGLNRRVVSALTASDLEDGGPLAGLGCTCGSDPEKVCPSHVVASWARLLPALRSGSRWRVQQAVGDGHDPDPDGAGMPGGSPLLFSVDQHGWTEPERPLSGRALTRICAVRLAQVSRPVPEHDPDVTVPGADDEADADVDGMSEATWDELFDRLDAITDELDARAAELLEEAQSQAEWVKAAWLEPRR